MEHREEACVTEGNSPEFEDAGFAYQRIIILQRI